jgi:hypothetical protein
MRLRLDALAAIAHPAAPSQAPRPEQWLDCACHLPIGGAAHFDLEDEQVSGNSGRSAWGQTCRPAHLQRRSAVRGEAEAAVQELTSGSKVGLPLESSLAPWRPRTAGCSKTGIHAPYPRSKPRATHPFGNGAVEGEERPLGSGGSSRSASRPDRLKEVLCFRPPTGASLSLPQELGDKVQRDASRPGWKKFKLTHYRTLGPGAHGPG